MTHTEARELANQFGSRMCDENGDTHNQELYCFDLDDIIALKEALAQPEQEPVAWIERDIQCDDFDPDSVRFEKPRIAASSGREWVPLYTSLPKETT